MVPEAGIGSQVCPEEVVSPCCFSVPAPCCSRPIPGSPSSPLPSFLLCPGAGVLAHGQQVLLLLVRGEGGPHRYIALCRLISLSPLSAQRGSLLRILTQSLKSYLSARPLTCEAPEPKTRFFCCLVHCDNTPLEKRRPPGVGDLPVNTSSIVYRVHLHHPRAVSRCPAWYLGWAAGPPPQHRANSRATGASSA